MKNIYTMKLHEVFYLPDVNMQIVRVAGGWLYRISDYPPVFVPWDNEFML